MAAGGTTSDPRLISMLLEDDVWRALHLADDAKAARNGAVDAAYLEQHVYPSLIPALAEMLDRVQLVNEQGSGIVPKSSCIADAATHPLGSVGPTVWLAQHLMRYNTRHSDALRHHPYGVLYAAAKASTAGPVTAAASAPSSLPQ